MSEIFDSFVGVAELRLQRISDGQILGLPEPEGYILSYEYVFQEEWNELSNWILQNSEATAESDSILAILFGFTLTFLVAWIALVGH